MNSAKVGQIIILAGGTIALYLLLRRLAHSQQASRLQAKHGSSDGRPAPDPTQSAQPTRGVRLCQVHPSPNDETKTDVDIIAIHGLDTKSPDTWIWDPKGARVNWLKDAHMLPGRFPTARIFTCDWPADLFEQPDFIQKTIEDFARLLLAGIKARPPATDDQPGSDRPIVFVASCLGGIVLIKALDMASREYLSVKKATRGIVFLATPFRGTSFQDVAKWAEPGLRAWASIQDKNVSNLLKDVKPTFELGELVRSFTTLCRENDLLDHVFTFYETGKSSLPRTIAPWLPASLSQEQPVQLPSLVLKPYSVEANVLQLVNKLSATPDFVGHPLPLDRPHRTMNKFSGPDDPGYVSVAGMLEVLLCDIRSGRPIEKADLWIRNNRYSPKELEIERLSGDLLPMDRCYINLAIVEKTGENAPPSKGEDEAQKVSPFSLLARLKVETLDKTIEVTLPTLFKRRKARDGQKRQPSRILIRGRAGVGKTTLCKKIVYEFTHGEKWQEWRDLFDRVLWVPLRNLKREERRRFRGYNSRHLFCDEYFSQHPRGDDLAEALWDATRATTSGRTLFILDGLDEVSQDLDGDMLSFLKELLNQPSVIITSRPHAMLPPGLDPIHLELETIGFYPDQVNAYVEKAFTDPETGKTDPEKPGEIQSYLQKHPLIQGLVRIPVQLDALCYTWSSFSDELIPQTMTGIYQAIEESLWKKDAVKLEIRTEAQMQFARPREIKSSIKTELYLLEALAFTGIHNDVIEFEPKHRDAISDQFNPTDSNLFLDGMLGRLSFLRTSDPSLKHRDRNYHFLHLTFQEYFAARYFVRQWKAGPLRCITLGDAENEYTKSADIEPATFLQMYKYHTRYDIFWRFVAGLLKDKAAGFFQTVEEEPRDILGPTHQRLIMHCLSEVSTGMAIRKTLEEKLSQWLLFECKFTQRSHLAAEMEFPEPALDTVLQSGPEDEDAKIILLGSLCRRAAIPPSVMDLAPSWLGVNVSQSLTLAILRLLGRQHKTLPSELLRAIAARIEDEASIVRYEALTALQGQTSLAPEMLQAISAKLEDGDRYVRCGAVKALQGQTLLAPEILQAIAARFEDEDSIVRWGAVKALQGQTLLTPEMLQAIAAQLADKSWPVRLAAIKALQNQTSLAPEILQAISAKLEDGDCYVRCGAVKALQGQTLLAPEILQAIAARLKDEDRIVRRAAVEALQGQASLTPAIVQAITVQLEDENSNVGQAAVEALQGQALLTPEMLQAIAAQLADKSWPVRLAAIEALQNQTSLAPEMLQAIAARLEDEEWLVKLAATEALQGQASLAPEILQAIAARLENKDINVRRAAAEVLQGQPVLPLDTLNQYLIPLYRAFLERSFEEPLSWLITGGSLYTVVGDRKVSLRCPQGQLMEAIRETQGVLGVPST